VALCLFDDSQIDVRLNPGHDWGMFEYVGVAYQLARSAAAAKKR